MKLSKVAYLEEPLNPKNYVGKVIQTLDGRFFLVCKRDSKYSLIPCDLSNWIDLEDEMALAVFNNKNGEAIAFYQEPVEEEPEDEYEYHEDDAIEFDLDELLEEYEEN